MKIFAVLFVLITLVSCGKPPKKEKGEDFYNGIWFRNYTMPNKDHATIVLKVDTTVASSLERISFPITTKDVYLHARVVTVDKKWTLSINNYSVIDCVGPNGYAVYNCRIEFKGVPAGTYLLEY